MAQPLQPSPIPSEDAIRKILVDRIDALHQSVGIVVAIVSAQGRRVVASGKLEKGDPRPLDGDTIFEIGSLTKVFTSLLLAAMVHHGEVSLDDPISKYLPSTVKVPHRNGRSITLIDLSTHTSGLPRLPTNMAPKDPANPYADYSVAQLYEFLSGYQLTRDIGLEYEYSNLGGGLLGHALALRAGMDYEELVKSRICTPLGMSSTAITLTPAMKARFATGHNADLTSAENWDLPTLAGAGALRSSANDILKFLSANLGQTKSPLAPAMASMLAVRRPTNIPTMQIALGWRVTTRDGREIAWHNGLTGGYRSYMGYDGNAGVGVVVLSNASPVVGMYFGVGISIDDIGEHLLDPGVPLRQPPPHKLSVVQPKIFNG
ncbi:MAG TPA: serine hydrolase domain-containing protein [Acidisarcina sp.]